jgi:hypothetical protein
MTDEEVEELVYMRNKASEYGLEYEVEMVFNNCIKAGDSVHEAVYCALYEWDLL